MAKPNKFSVPLAHNTALGHVNLAVEKYKQFEKLAHSKWGGEGTMPFDEVVQLTMPIVTNLSLGLEILLKIHHFQLTGEYSRGHDVAELGNTFPDESMEVIRAKYKEMYEDPSIHNGMAFRFSGGTTGEKAPEWQDSEITNYDDAIQYIGPTYKRWRYIYEEFGDSFDIRLAFGPLYFAAMSVDHAIKSYKGNIKISFDAKGE